MKRFSKNDNQAICNYCGQWRPTDLTNQQLEEMDWKCDQCKAKEGTPEIEPTEQERGSKEISKYDPEYTFLVKLVKLLVTEGVSPQEIKSIADAYPFVTVDDVGDLTAKLWTLATEKYKIPREWLMRRLPKNASLKIAGASRWRGQEEANDMINHAPGYIAYEYGQDKTSKDEFTGAEFSRNDVGVNPTLDNGPFSSPEDHGAKPQKSPFPNTNWLPADDQNLDQQAPSNVAASLEKKAFLDHAYWIDPKGQAFEVRGAENNMSDYSHYDWIADHQDTLQEIYGLSDITEREELVDAGWVRIGDSSTDNWQVEVADVTKVPSFIDNILAQFASEGAMIDFADHNDNFVQVPWPWKNAQAAINKAMRMQQQQQMPIAAAFKRPFSKIAGLDGRYWIAPDGTEFNAGTHHGAWVGQHADVLKQYGIKNAKNLNEAYAQMFASGWSRVSNERGFTIQVADLKHVPAYLDDFIAKHYAKGDVIRIGTDNEMVEVSDPFPSLQRQVNKALQQIRASLKEADLSGQTVNQIVNALHANGGVTWNLSNGNMVGTDNYAVAIYPDRAQILEGGADFDRVEEFITSNSDLLDSPENSFGAWSHDGKIYLDVVATIPDINQAVELGKKHNQIAIWDLKNAESIPTGGTGEVKQASQQPVLPQPLQDEVAAKTSPVYNIALTNYAEAVKRGHEKDRALEYAIKSVSNIEHIDSKKFVELINEYL